jgi:uncharacterized membrane protein
MLIEQNKIIALIVGTIAGVLGFYFTNHEDNGPYSIGIGKVSELIGILIFFTGAAISNEPISVGLMQMIVGWHITNFVYYRGETDWL